MGTHRYARRISASPADVFHVFADPDLVTDWMEASRVVDASGPLDVAGTRFTLVIWGPWRFATRVIRSDPGRLYETYATGPFGADYRMVAALTPLDDGGTSLDLLMEWTVPLGPIGRWIDQRWIEPGPHTSGNREVDRLVTLATEARSPAGEGLPSRGAMAEGRSGTASVYAGILAGIAGLATFLLVHHVWIVPIWFIALSGALFAAAGGAAVGAAYGELFPYLPRRPWTVTAVIAAAGIVLLPAVLIAEVRGPLVAMEGGAPGTLLVSGAEAVAYVVVGLLGTATIAGYALGWLVARTRRAGFMTALAAVALALGPGHNVPMLGGTSALTRELAILAVVVGVASVVLVEGQALLGARRPG